MGNIIKRVNNTLQHYWINEWATKNTSCVGKKMGGIKGEGGSREHIGRWAFQADGASPEVHFLPQGRT